jgi:hypothetical protein
MTRGRQPLDYQTPQPRKKLHWAAVLGICAMVFFAFVVFGGLFFRSAGPMTATPAIIVSPTASQGYVPATTQPTTRAE